MSFVFSGRLRNTVDMMRTLLLALILLLPVTGYAQDSWLCIAERIAMVTDDETDVLSAESGEFERKYLVTEEGLKIFGNQTFLLDDCTWTDGIPFSCASSVSGVADYFRLNVNYVFMLRRIYVNQTDDGKVTISDAIIKGKCSKL